MDARAIVFKKKEMNLTPVKSKKYKNIYYFDLKGDKKYFFRYKKDGKVYKKIVGLKSEGVTEKFCYEQIAIKEFKEYALNEFALRYFESRSLYASSISRLKKCYQNKIQDSELGKMNISDINRTLVESWQKIMLEKHNMSKSYINWHTMLMSAIVNYAINTGLYKGVNPFLKCKFSNCESIRERFLSKDEIKLLFDALKSDVDLYLFTLVALSTGARLQSILNIRKKDVNLTESYINIRDTKNSTTYKAFFAKELATLLKEVCDSIDNQNLFILDMRRGDCYKLKKLKKILDELFNKNLDKKDSVNRVVIHTFRHTFASHLAIQGVPIIKIQALLNHKNIQMTMRYAKLAPDAGKSEAIELARGFFAS